MKGKLLFLGTGGSTGVPMVGCGCAVCTSKDPHNQRLRPSVLLTMGEKKLLIDTGPDFRMQCLKFQIRQLDGVLITHTHFDHIAGLDELRTFYLLKHQVLPILLSKTSFSEVQKRFDYLFQIKSQTSSLAAQLDFHVLENTRGTVDFQGVAIRYLTYRQGGMNVTGFCFGNCAYLSDIRDYEESIFEDLKGINTLIISALRFTPSPVHFSVEEAVAFAQKSGAEKVYFMHIAHELDHEQTNAQLPSGMSLAYDGQMIEIENGKVS